MIYYYLLWVIHTYLLILLLTGEFLVYKWTNEYKTLFVSLGIATGLMTILIVKLYKNVKQFLKE